MLDKNKEKELEEKYDILIVSEIEYYEKTYIKTIKTLDKGFNYIYYELKDNQIIELKDENILLFFKVAYELEPSNIIE